MATARSGLRKTRPARPWWRPIAFSATVAAAIGALFHPMPGYAAPGAPPVAPVSVPDTGSRPVSTSAITLPGQSPVNPGTGTTGTSPTSTSIPGSATNPTLQKIENGRNEISVLGDQLITLRDDRDLAVKQAQNATDVYTTAETAMNKAKSDADRAAADAFMQAAAMPPGSSPLSGLGGLSDLAQLQHGDTGSSDIAALQVQNTQIAAQLALNEMNTAKQHAADLSAQYDKQNTQLSQKQTAQQTLENANAGLLAAAEQSENTQDSNLGANYLAGANQGQGADPRAIQALDFALAQRGKKYVWSTEGPDTYDCSGLTYASYRLAGFDLERVSRDQYWQTRDKVVDRYSLLPGDLLFFSYTNSWTGIHHVAMYAGNGLMVEAPRTGLNVRLVPVRWSRLFQATRVFGSVPGGVTAPPIGAPDPDSDSVDTTPTPTHTPSPTPDPTKTTKPGTPPTTKPTSPSGSPSSSGPPSTEPSGGTTSPSTSPSGSTSPTPTPDPGGSGSSPTTGTTGGTSSPTGSDATTPSEHATTSAASSASTHSPSASTSSAKPASATVSATASGSASAAK